nr:hypothetical protein NeseNPV-TR_ORF69 [Neodiprion sertifer nucleopolyhedrovirus]
MYRTIRKRKAGETLFERKLKYMRFAAAEALLMLSTANQRQREKDAVDGLMMLCNEVVDFDKPVWKPDTCTRTRVYGDDETDLLILAQALSDNDYVEINCCMRLVTPIEILANGFFKFKSRCRHLCINNILPDVTMILNHCESLHETLNYLWLSKWSLPEGLQFLSHCKNVSTFIIDVTFFSQTWGKFILSECYNIRKELCATQIDSNLYIHSKDISFNQLCKPISLDIDFETFDVPVVICGKKKYIGKDIIYIETDVYKIYSKRFTKQFNDSI